MSISILRLFPFYWTRQHGAYITMITAWVVAVILTGFSYLQPLALIFLLASLNFTELVAEKINRKTRLPSFKHSWLNIYGIVTVFSGTLLLLYSQTFRILAILLLAGAVTFVLLTRRRKQKTITAELLTFAFFVVAAFSGSVVTDWPLMVEVMIIMTLFFGSSVFTVKWRFKKISALTVLLYTFFSMITIGVVAHDWLFSVLVCTLIFFKTAGCWAIPDWFRTLPIKKIGMIEAAFQVVLLLIFFVFY
jgi:hypothetical protein